MKEKYHTRIHDINENFFKSWSHDMAYIFGFWFADGVIHNSLFSITQKHNDKYILEKIAKIMQSEYPIGITKTKYGVYSRFYLYSMVIVNDIIMLGGKERKSLDCVFPNIPQIYISDFIRGYFDGDGSIGFYKKRNSYDASFTSGSKRFLFDLYCILKNEIASFGGSFQEKQGLKNKYYTIQITRNDIIRLRKFMYSSSSELFLKRKRDIFERVGEFKSFRRGFLSYNEARKIVVYFGIKSRAEWNIFSTEHKRPLNIPSTPNRSYENKGWVSWKEFLGYEETRKNSKENKCV